MVETTTPYLAGHARHDPMRVAEAVDRGARPSVGLGLDLCGWCSALYTDLMALTAALPLAAVPMRRRDFTLSPADARRLRHEDWRAWWSRIGSARDMFTRPLGIGFTTLGLVGLLLTTAPMLTPMAGAGAAAGPGATAAIERYTVAASQPGAGTPSPNGADTSVQPGAQAGPGAPESSSTLSLSLGLLAAGGGLFAVRRIAAYRRRVR